MTNEEKGIIYDECVRESDRLQRINSKFKSDYPINIPQHIQSEIDSNNIKIEFLVKKLESLFQ